MSSTVLPQGVPRDTPDWRVAGLRFFSYGFYLRQRFGKRIQKVSVDGGFTCPNVDGRVAVGGCTFCDNRSFSPSRRLPRQDIRDQIEEGIRRLQRRYRCDRFLAYFQPATNTYAPVDHLERLYGQALSHPQVVGLAIGTRPDCVDDDVLDLLESFAKRTYLTVEYGMQTKHDRSLTWMNRGHDHAATVDAIVRSRGRGFPICVHIMIGLPGESHEDIMATACEVARLGVDAIKIHNLYVVRNTPLEEQWRRGEVSLMERPTYVRTIVDLLERLPPTTVVERVSGEAPPDYFLAPSWCLDKPALRGAIDEEFCRRETWQGKRYGDLV